MNTIDKIHVLVVEDDPDWAELICDDCARLGWRTTLKDNVPDAIRQLESEDTYFDILIADKGGSNALRGGTDIIGHRDGLSVLRLSNILQPHCIRVLATGENWTHSLFADSSLGLHIFLDKGFYAENAESMYAKLQRMDGAPTGPHIIDVYDHKRSSRKEM